MKRAIAGFACLAALGATLPGCEIQAYARILSPADGEFVVGDTVEVSGILENVPITPSTEVHVNGVVATIDEEALTWTATVPLDQAAVFNRIVAEARLLGAVLTTQQVNVIAVDGVNTAANSQGEFARDGVALRLSNTGLDQIEPVVQDLAGDALDIGAIITAQNPLLDNDPVFDLAGITVARATVNAVDVGIGGFALDATSTGPGSLDTTVRIDDLYVDVELDVGGPLGLVTLITCGLELTASTASIQAKFDLGPSASNPRQVDVNQVGGIGVTLEQLEPRFISGICDDPIIGTVVDLIAAGLINDLLVEGFESNLGDPDGAGPLDSPIADAIEATLAGIAVGGPVGDSIGVMLDTEIASITEDTTGFSLLVDAAVSQPNRLPTAPDFIASYAVLNEAQPAFGDTTPGGEPYGLAFGISASAMNQMLAALVEGGLLALDIEELAIPPLILDPIPLDVSVMTFLVPEFATAGEPTDQVIVQVRPTMAPVLTGKGGPNGEMFEIKIGGLEVSFTLPSNPDFVPLALNLTVTAGVDLAFTEKGMEFELGSIVEDEIDAYITVNAIEADETTLLDRLEGAIPFFVAPLSDAIEPFAIPDLLGLNLEPVELARVGTWITLYANLTKIPTSFIRNVVITDQSEPDYRFDTLFDVEQWRHRVSGSWNSNAIEATLKGFLGADACCTTGDRQAVADAAYSVRFEVVSVPNESWQLELMQSINGAFDLKDDSVLLSDGGGFAEFRDGGVVSASYVTSTGLSGSFNFVPNPVRVEHAIGSSRSDTYRPFSGSNQLTLSGTGDMTVTVDIAFKPRARSDSNLFLPAVAGDKAGIRFGKQDTIDNHFNIGRYPGVGNRNIADDGHMLNVTLTSIPQ